jgi:hypothetical protein
MTVFYLKAAWEVENTLNRRNRHRKYMSAYYITLKTLSQSVHCSSHLHILVQ